MAGQWAMESVVGVTGEGVVLPGGCLLWLTAPGATASHRIVHDTQTMLPLLLLLNWARCRDGLKTILSRVRFDAHFTFSVFCCFFFRNCFVGVSVAVASAFGTFDGGNVWSLCAACPPACLPLCCAVLCYAVLCALCCSVCLPRSERCEILALAFVARCSAPAL